MSSVGFLTLIEGALLLFFIGLLILILRDIR